MKKKKKTDTGIQGKGRLSRWRNAFGLRTRTWWERHDEGEEIEEKKNVTLPTRLGGPERNSERKVLGAQGISFSAGVLLGCSCCCFRCYGNRPFVLLLPQHDSNVSLLGKVRKRIHRERNDDWIEGCDAHSFPHREKKTTHTKQTLNDPRMKKETNKTIKIHKCANAERQFQKIKKI